jgi:hypothetical protein
MSYDGIDSVVGKRGLFMCRFASLFQFRSLKGNIPVDARDFNNIERQALIMYFPARQGAEGN